MTTDYSFHKGNAYSGPNHAAEYQVSGMPYVVTGSGTRTLQIPYVTQWIIVKSTSGTVSAGFTSGGMVDGNKFSVAVNTSFGPLYLKIKDLYLEGGSWEVVAGLTAVPRDRMFNYVHPNASGSIGPNSGSADGIGYTGI